MITGILVGYRLHSLSSVPVNAQIFLFSIVSRPALMATQPPIQRVQGVLFPVVKQKGHEADHLPPYNVKIKNCGVILPLPICLHDIILNYLSTRETLPLLSTSKVSRC
jgi:hypothetical protein